MASAKDGETGCGMIELKIAAGRRNSRIRSESLGKTKREEGGGGGGKGRERAVEAEGGGKEKETENERERGKEWRKQERWRF